MISRRNFFRYILWIAFVSLIVITDKMLRQYKRLNKNANAEVLKSSLSKGANFFSGLIIIYKKQEYKVFSSKCTHLGCSINKAEGQRLVCPCHGSQYNLDGLPVKGPASKPLQNLDFENQENKLVVKMNS